MINLEKLNRKSASPLALPLPPFLFKKTCPAPNFHPLFLIFQIPFPPLGEVFKIYFPPFKKGPNYGVLA